MARSNYIGGIILGAAVGVALLKFYSMPKEERDEFLDHLKNRAHDLLDDAEGTVEQVKQHFAEIDAKQSNELVDKLFVFKRLLSNLFGSERRFLI
ncbi:MAG: YtxH domain-containing protein [Chitinophagaceae bacterium]|nr:YtxH domain-containing protein [Chitinophagaceae bacterium]